MTPAEYDAYEGRIEFFDSRAGAAWMAREPAHFPHERPLHRLGALLERIALTRGKPIVSSGAAEIRWPLPEGQSRRIQPDQMVYLDPATLDRSGPRYLNASEQPFPDVVVEVDSTTDVRGNRLKLYEAWGFSEVWVEVPNAYAPGRRPGMRSELRIYLLEDERYVASDTSRAFPGWRADEIHRALNESSITNETAEILVRVGRAVRAADPARESAEPKQQALGQDPLFREQRSAARAGLARALLTTRGIAVSPDFPAPGDRAALDSASDAAIATAALAATSESDFLARLADGDNPCGPSTS